MHKISKIIVIVYNLNICLYEKAFYMFAKLMSMTIYNTNKLGGCSTIKLKVIIKGLIITNYKHTVNKNIKSMFQAV